MLLCDIGRARRAKRRADVADWGGDGTKTMPPRTVELRRADVLGAADEMVREIQNQLPEYEARGLRRGVDLALRRYVELLDQQVGRPTRGDGGGPATDWLEVYRWVGAN